MKRKPIIIGKKIFKYKKNALEFYKNILNSYSFNESLNDEDYSYVYDLLQYSFLNNNEKENEIVEENNNNNNDEVLYVEDIRIAKVQYNTKCFQIIDSDGDTWLISYIMMINKTKTSPRESFNKACRNTIQADLIKLKQEFFKTNWEKGYVKCQETQKKSKWEELVVDHRQPNTFSIIVDRFIEVFKIDIENIEYEISKENFLLFKDKKLSENFREYHKEKANLRVIRKECNSSRAYQGRITTQSKDLRIP